MAWTEDQWAAFVTMLSRGFAARDPFTDEDAAVYRVLLDGVEPELAHQALRQLVLEGQALRPKPGEIVDRARRDSGRPTFDEAYRLIFGPRGVLAARPSSSRWADAAERSRAFNEAAMERARGMHPLIASFVERQGLDRLRQMPLDDDDYGELRRREMQARWDEHVDVSEGREVQALAAGSGREGMRRLDPLAAVSALDRPPVPSLPVADDTERAA